jgi:hypothetical protein
MANILRSGRRSLLIGGAAAVAGLAMIAGRREDAAAREQGGGGTSGGPWAVELFTSQGCSSCPPADAELGTLAKRADIVALSFHVDYWDYIGWKDPFASRETTQRQHVYARSLKQRYVYTPEMVVDGRGDGPGVTSGEVAELLADAQRKSGRRATPELTRLADGSVLVKLAPFDLLDGFANGPAEVTLAVYDRHLSTAVHQGENNGRRLDNFNVVRHFELLGGWKGEAATWTMAAERAKPEQGVAVLVQRAGQGAMLGCNKLEANLAG